MNREHFFTLARNILETPTAPFHERMVVERLQSLIGDNSLLSDQLDRYGNYIVRYCHPEIDAARVPAIAAIAHMDHPGFEISEVRDGLVLANMYGWITADHLKGSSVVVETARGQVWGRITDIDYEQKNEPTEEEQLYRDPIEVLFPQSRPRRVVSLTLAMREKVEVGDFGHSGLVGYEEVGPAIRSRSIDDLAGCSVVLATLLELAETNAKTHFIGIFSRAEENGLNGALALMQDDMLPKDTWLISVEASHKRAGVDMGKGPVIRLGDHHTIFDLALVNHLRESAAQLKEENANFMVQQRVMDGGTCESTAYAAFGYRSAGIALPLGNYHNMSEDPHDPHLRPEYIYKDDLWWAYILLLRAAVNGPHIDADNTALRKRLMARAGQFLEKLIETV